ncbi:hypothetical protein PG999_014746 [Apiospora kogelbergensis]|uniref:Hydrophobin n=1 Tax=Apiospora kogelbergensis TaxID=1337665 RepID=A0AAW0Q3Q5_9PEZI
MQFSQLSAILLAAVATAMPAPANPSGHELTTRGDDPDGGYDTNDMPSTCDNMSTQVCCNGLLTCVVQVLGAYCGEGVYCCETDSGVGNFINIDALNCVQL